MFYVEWKALNVQLKSFNINMPNKVNIAGVQFNPIRYKEVLTAIEVFVGSEGQHMIFTPNPEMLVDANRRPEFNEVLNAASLLVPDGIGILWAAYYLSLPKPKSKIGYHLQAWSSLFKILFKSKAIYRIFPERVTGADLLLKIVEASQGDHWPIFLLGAAPGVANIAMDRLLKKYPGAIFAGSFAGTPAETHEEELCELINRAQPKILFVAYGSPAQEEWIARNLKKLPTVKVALGVGGAIDFAAGRTKRAPLFMQKIGLEWLWRLVRQPKRIKRIWTATITFVRMIIQSKASH